MWQRYLVNVANNDGGEEDLGEGDAAVERRLDGGVHELGGVVVKKETAGNNRPHHDQGPKRTPEKAKTIFTNKNSKQLLFVEIR